MGMEANNSCLATMNFAVCWADWRAGLKKTIKESRTYYLDETVQNLLSKLDNFLTQKVCPSSAEEKLIEGMWTVASLEERTSLAGILLKMADIL